MFYTQYIANYYLLKNEGSDTFSGISSFFSFESPPLAAVKDPTFHFFVIISQNKPQKGTYYFEHYDIILMHFLGKELKTNGSSQFKLQIKISVQNLSNFFFMSCVYFS
jgi:hypothetical protein